MSALLAVLIALAVGLPPTVVGISLKKYIEQTQVKQ